MTAYSDFRFTSTGDLADLGGPASRFKYNITAIKLLKRLEAECRPPVYLTPDEQLTFARYSGRGDTEVFSHTFKQISGCAAEPCGKLKGLLTEEEIGSLRASTLNAHYTRFDLIRAIYETIERLGLAAWGKLRILEPAAGIGHFLGVMPATLADGAKSAAIELDSITARILARLYPSTRVFASGFENVRLPRDYFDLIVSNVLFANVSVHDPVTRDRRLRDCVHDYFFVKSLPLLKPGRILAFITSRYTLDNRKSVVRRHLAMHTELLAAVRLPSGAFKQNARTDVTTDVIILRKRPSPIDPDHATAQEWVEAGAQRLFDEHGSETELPANKPRGHSISVITPRPRLLNWRGYVAGKRQLGVVSADEIPPDVMDAVALACLAQIEADTATHQNPAAQNRILNPVRRLREIAHADMPPTPPIPLP